MTCNNNDCLQEGNTKCKACKAEFCIDHIKHCEECGEWFCSNHLDKHECEEEEEHEKEFVPAKKSKIENDNASHGVKLNMSGEINKNTINKIDAMLEIHHINVGQGDSTLILIKSYKGDIYKSILIDSGKKSEPITDYFDQLINREKDGEKYFRPIDIFITTHPDKDHVGGAVGILTRKNEAKEITYTNPKAILYDNGTPYGKFDREYETYLACAEKHKFNRKRPPLGAPIKGGKILDEHGVILRCLAYNGVLSNGYTPDKSPYYHLELGYLQKNEFSPEQEQQMNDAYYPTNDNNLSIALHLQFGKFSYFTAGDLSGEYEDEVTHHINYFYGPVSAWKASHHGAKECTSEKATGYLQGGVCVFSFQAMNEYGHPFQAPIDHLENLNKAGVSCTYYCTGAILNRKPPSLQYGTKGENGRVDQGTIVITAVESDVKAREKFFVQSKSSNDMYELKPREKGLLAVAPSPHKGKSSNPVSPSKKAASAERKVQREKDKLSAAVKALKKKILAMLDKEETDWLALYAGFKERFDEKVAYLAKTKGNQPDYSHDPLGDLGRAAKYVIGKPKANH